MVRGERADAMHYGECVMPTQQFAACSERTRLSQAKSALNA